MIDTDTLQQMLLAITMEQPFTPATAEEQAVFEQLLIEVTEIEARGDGIEIPFEIPE